MVDLLFDMYPELTEFYVSRFAVGHTHADLDRFFGYINQILFGISPGGEKKGVHVLTRDEFERLIRKALGDKKDTMLLDVKIEDLLFTFDFWSFLKTHKYSGFSGYGSSGQVHVLRFQRRAGCATPHISYKFWWQSPQWLPEDGSSLKILNTRPTYVRW